MTISDNPVATTLSIRDFTRSGKILQNYDYIDIEDKKSHQYKGLFVSKTYAEEVKAFLDEKISQERKKKTNNIMAYAGIADGDTENKTYAEFAAERKTRYH